jgi:ribosomal protein S18 acetylase RimI-like enzyme
MVDISKLDEARWREFMELQLEALCVDPLAFGSSYEDEAGMPEEEWRRRSKNVLFALEGNRPVGMITLGFDERQKKRHIAAIYGFYVRKESRNQGIGKRLIESAIKTISEREGISKIQLHVNPMQTAAVKLYEEFGFERVGVLKKELKVNGIFYDILLMEKYL